MTPFPSRTLSPEQVASRAVPTTRDVDALIDELDAPPVPLWLVPKANTGNRTNHAHPYRTLTLTKRGERRVRLMRLTDSELHALGSVYATFGLIDRRPEYLCDRQAVIEAILAAEQGPAPITLAKTP